MNGPAVPGNTVLTRETRTFDTAKLANGEAYIACVYTAPSAQGGARITGDGTLQNPLKVIRTPEQASASVLRAALRPFAHPDLSEPLHGGATSPEQPVYGRNKAVLKLRDFQTAAAMLRSLDAIDEALGIDSPVAETTIASDLPKFTLACSPGSDPAGRDWNCDFMAEGVTVRHETRSGALALAETMARFLSALK